MKRRRTALGLTQDALAKEVGIHGRQIRRYEAGDAVPTLDTARLIAEALGISLDELAGGESRQLYLAGKWWACWQTWKDGEQVINCHVVQMRQAGELLTVTAETRGTQELADGGYLWRGQLQLFDDALMGWYIATEGAVRSKGTMYFQLHQHGQWMTGRWVGLSYDGPLVTGWGAIARNEDDALKLMNDLLKEGPTP